jgi:hypothetical protein
MRAKSSAYRSKWTASCPNIGGASPSKAFSRFSRPFMKRPNRSGLRGHLTRSQVTGWNPLEGSTKSSCGKLRLGVLRDSRKLRARVEGAKHLALGFKSYERPKSRESGTISGLHLGNPRKKNHLDVASAESCKESYKGEGGGFPRVWAVVSLVVQSARGLSQHPRVSRNVN